MLYKWKAQLETKGEKAFTSRGRPKKEDQSDLSGRDRGKTICTSIISAAGLGFGAEKSGSSKLVDRVDLVLPAIEILPLESSADREYAKLRHYLAHQGALIGPYNMLIAPNNWSVLRAV